MNHLKDGKFSFYQLQFGSAGEWLTYDLGYAFREPNKDYQYILDDWNDEYQRSGYRGFSTPEIAEFALAFVKALDTNTKDWRIAFVEVSKSTRELEKRIPNIVDRYNLIQKYLKELLPNLDECPDCGSTELDWKDDEIVGFTHLDKCKLVQAIGGKVKRLVVEELEIKVD